MDFPFVDIHTHRRTLQGIEMVSATPLSEKLPARPRSLGIHPWQAGEIDTAAALREVAAAPVDAIGEIGLDYACPVSRQLQAEVFEAQLRIACERGLPVILHCVRAFEPVMKALGDYRLRAAIFHGFTGSPQQAGKAVSEGYSLSFGERSLGSPRSVDAMRNIPASRLFLETDESTLAIAEIYARAARLLGADGEDLKKQIHSNYVTIFGK